jgi:hypothetical protein
MRGGKNGKDITDQMKMRQMPLYISESEINIWA